MRLIWTTDNIEQLRKFVYFLRSQGIECVDEERVERDWDNADYGIKNLTLWVYNEDQVATSQELLSQFLQNPNAPIYSQSSNPPIVPSNIKIEASHTPSTPTTEDDQNSSLYSPLQQSRFRLTNFLILLCSILLLIGLWTTPKEEATAPNIKDTLLAVSPLEKALLFDYPRSYELLDKMISLYGYQSLLKPNNLPPPGKFLFETYLESQSWHGIYPQLISWGRLHLTKQKESELASPELSKDVELFEKIRQGEIWRLVSPILLHGDILHLFFNMVWLLILGTQMEMRVGMWPFFWFIIAVAIVSNTCQYLVGGPAFIGFSGVVCGMAFFIRSRQKIAPWEGYQMSSGIFQFILFFIGILALLSVSAFFLEVYEVTSFPIAIANTAHLAGALTGYLLGRLDLFAWR